MEDPAGKNPKPFHFTLFELLVIILDAISHQNTVSSENCWPAVSEELHRPKSEKGGNMQISSSWAYLNCKQKLLLLNIN